MEILNEINNNLTIEKNKNSFLDSIIGKTINSAIDIGLRAILPDLIENQVIDIKNSLFENGLKSGINTAINSAIEFGKSAAGIITGNFENVSQVRIAIGNGGIVDTISNVLDKAINISYQKGYINRNIKSVIKSGKDIILENITKNINKELDEQSNSIENLEKHVNNWKEYYNNKDFERMSKEYEKIELLLNKVIPLENILKETRKVELLHNLIKNNGQNFNITENEKKLVENLS